MKTVKYLAIVLTSLFLFAACQKEFSYESGLSGDHAAGSLKDTSGNCLPVVINGNYAADSALTDSNYVIVQVNFSAPGSYSIATDSSNGFSFQGTGVTKDSGLQNIILKGTGKPTLAEQTAFLIAFDSSVCTFSIAVAKKDSSAAGDKAVFTLAGSPNTCSNANINGSYQEGMRLDSTNQVSIEVDVTAAGSYTILAGPTNGMTFSTQGTFTATGVQTVILQGSGTPDSAVASAIPINASGTSCSFTVTVNSSEPPGADSGWQFSAGTNFSHGFIDTAETHKDTSIGDATALSFYGSSYPGQDSLFQLDILLPGNTIQTGTYNTDSANADFYLYSSADPAATPFYKADYLTTPKVNIQVVIKSYDAATGIISGTFSGTAVNSSGQKVIVTGGKIYAKVD